jgi:hypothetical protein
VLVLVSPVWVVVVVEVVLDVVVVVCIISGEPLAPVTLAEIEDAADLSYDAGVMVVV